MFSAVERQVLEHDRNSNGELIISREAAQSLIASGHYLSSTGAPYTAKHFRRSLDDDSCLHLVIENDATRLHHDKFDPHAGPFSLYMHLTEEARWEVVSSCAVAVCLVKILAQ